MSFHINAWEEVELLIIGKTDLVPMRIEQSISLNIPTLDGKIASFENYNDAFDHSKNSKRVNLIFIEDNDYDAETIQIVENLSSHYEKTGFPCLFLCYYTNTPNLNSFKSMTKNRKFIDYIPASDLIESDKIKILFEDFWDVYVDKVKQNILSDDQEQSFRSFLNVNTSEELTRLERTINIFKSSLNLSWKENLLLELYPIISNLQSVEDIYNNHKGLFDFVNEYIPTDDAIINIDYSDKENNLPKRIVSFAKLILLNKNSESLNEFTEQVKGKSRRKQGALEKHLIKNQYILEEVLYGNRGAKLRIVNE